MTAQSQTCCQVVTQAQSNRSRCCTWCRTSITLAWRQLPPSVKQRCAGTQAPKLQRGHESIGVLFCQDPLAQRMSPLSISVPASWPSLLLKMLYSRLYLAVSAADSKRRTFWPAVEHAPIFREIAAAEEGNPRYARDEGHQLARWALTMRQKTFRIEIVSVELEGALRMSDAPKNQVLSGLPPVHRKLRCGITPLPFM